jgi:hypothetical protein
LYAFTRLRSAAFCIGFIEHGDTVRNPVDRDLPYTTQRIGSTAGFDVASHGTHPIFDSSLALKEFQF